MAHLINYYGVYLYLAGWLIFLFTMPRITSKVAENETGKDKKDTLLLAKAFIITSPIYPVWLVGLLLFCVIDKISQIDFTKFWAIFGVKNDL